MRRRDKKIFVPLFRTVGESPQSEHCSLLLLLRLSELLEESRRTDSLAGGSQERSDSEVCEVLSGVAFLPRGASTRATHTTASVPSSSPGGAPVPEKKPETRTITVNGKLATTNAWILFAPLSLLSR